ncbi:hypothetical protein PAE975_6054 (plasmid) [Pseudomonas aeruginosa]|uniref:hypothetical protein n=1 Tax=Pseudomonas aeruginosa TaxID=287 RepID=UPI001A322FFC|nr:hypothetical protein [Pseudomonas aeruginosa]MBH8699164.1 hypothetical protein [Pseudomonas aeruginosa]HEK3608675.1 hypothetical protein [Pseudomonas aeruginosa]
MISQYISVALSPGQIAAGQDARFQVSARVSLAIAVLAIALLLTVVCLINVACLNAGMRPFMSHYHDLVLVSQGERIAYTVKDWLSILGQIGNTFLLMYLCSKAAPFVERYLGDRKAAKCLNQWLAETTSASTIHVPGMSSRAGLQVIAMSCSLNAGRGVVDAVCLDEMNRPVLITGLAGEQAAVEAKRTHDHYLIQTALNCHFAKKRHALARALNLQPDGIFPPNGNQLSGVFQ